MKEKEFRLDPNGDIIDSDGACSLLGISMKTFQKLIREENMPGRKIGREWRFSREALIEWIGDGKSKEYKDK